MTSILMSPDEFLDGLRTLVFIVKALGARRAEHLLVQPRHVVGGGVDLSHRVANSAVGVAP